RETTESLERFRLQDAALRGYQFFWGELADWYLEAAKSRLRGDAGAASQRAAQAVLAEALDTALRLLHPAMPFITEAVWRKLPRAAGDAPALIVARWPAAAPEWEDDAAEAGWGEVMETIGAVRNLRAEYGVAPGTRVPLRVAPASDAARSAIEGSLRALQDLGRVGELEWGAARGEVGASAVLRSGTELFVPLAGVIDLDRERTRLRAELERIVGLSAGTEKKLSNESFVARAPADVVDKEREKLAGYGEQRVRLAAKLAALEGAA
ncbi:MAG TPA: class I tRNA ligase family protein, partial [Longimicrobium sp.]|nr:class I tRNA ligase family protein [Longimicrobium sp.]